MTCISNEFYTYTGMKWWTPDLHTTKRIASQWRQWWYSPILNIYFTLITFYCNFTKITQISINLEDLNPYINDRDAANSNNHFIKSSSQAAKILTTCWTYALTNVKLYPLVKPASTGQARNHSILVLMLPQSYGLGQAYALIVQCRQRDDRNIRTDRFASARSSLFDCQRVCPQSEAGQMLMALISVLCVGTL